MKEHASNVSFGDMVTIRVDPQVASHAGGVVTIIINSKVMGGTLACADGGYIVNGQTKMEWWIASDGYILKACGRGTEEGDCRCVFLVSSSEMQFCRCS